MAGAVAMPIIPVSGSLRQENQEFEASLGYNLRPWLKEKKSAISMDT
jgi:hypothetical protein